MDQGVHKRECDNVHKAREGRSPMAKWPPAVQLLGVGWYVAVCIVAGVLAGLWLDDTVGTGPALTLVGLALGLAASGWGGYRMLQQVLDAQARRRRPQAPNRSDRQANGKQRDR